MSSVLVDFFLLQPKKRVVWKLDCRADIEVSEMKSSSRSKNKDLEAHSCGLHIRLLRP
jgi:hypothetical protein